MKPTTRINKALSQYGYCSRRQADVLVQQGRVAINGKKAVPGDRVAPGDVVTVDGKPVEKTGGDIFLAFNKLYGITCTTDKRIKGNVIDYINYPERVFYVGRLDKRSEGLLLLTNQGGIVNKVLRAGNRHEKEYIVKVDKPITPDFLKQMRQGVPILGTVTKKCRVVQRGKDVFEIVLVQGLNRQIRRMCEHLGYRVVSLRRTRIMHIRLGNLPSGKWRKLTEDEVKKLYKAVSRSDERPMKEIKK